MNDFTTSNFLNTTKYTHINRSMTIIVPPSSNQRVRYENECKHIFRYLSIPDNGTLTIKVNKNSFYALFYILNFNRFLIFVVFLLLMMLFGCG